jgi:hypothetical protein
MTLSLTFGVQLFRSAFGWTQRLQGKSPSFMYRTWLVADVKQILHPAKSPEFHFQRNFFSAEFIGY